MVKLCSKLQVAKMVEGHMNPLNAYLNTMHVKTDVPSPGIHLGAVRGRHSVRSVVVPKPIVRNMTHFQILNQMNFHHKILS